MLTGGGGCVDVRETRGLLPPVENIGRVNSVSVRSVIVDQTSLFSKLTLWCLVSHHPGQGEVWSRAAELA